MRDSAFIEVAAGAAAVNLRKARASIVGNASDRTTWPVQIADLDGTEVVVAGNRFRSGAAGIRILDVCLGEPWGCGWHDTQFVLAGNQRAEIDGVEITATVGARVRCAVIRSTIQYDAAHGGG